MGIYFGTDGIRGVAGELLTPEFAVQVGRATIGALPPIVTRPTCTARLKWRLSPMGLL